MDFAKLAIREKQARQAKQLAARQAMQRRWGVVVEDIPATYTLYALQCKLGDWCKPGHINRYEREGILVKTGNGYYTGQSAHVLLMLIEDRQFRSEIGYKARQDEQPRHDRYGTLGYGSEHRY